MHEQQDRRRWLVLGIGLLGLIAGCAAQYGLAYLIPALRSEGYSLEEATLLVSAPIVGILLTLIAWGAAADRWGERVVLGVGLAGAGASALGAAGVDGLLARWILLFAVGATSSAIHAASGRLILGWFAASQRGLAMGIRQMGQPLGVGVAALVLPPLAAAGLAPPLMALGAGCLVSAVLVALLVRDPARPSREPGAERPRSPYREAYLWRIHLASALLVVPQWAVAVFAFDFLVTARGWSIGGAGTLLAVTALLGAGSRLAAGSWSDRVRSRLGPMRAVAVVIGAVMVALAVTAVADVAGTVVVLALAAVVTVSPNGLAFTAVAERAGSRWAGRALGIQNTFQNLVAGAAAPPLAVLIGLAGGGTTGYGLAFAVVAGLPFLAAVAVPARDERLGA
ncbi:MAG TPA: MFS transporter [Candidatus Limnocylindria bacterium]|nr:MFS transporter [Candidatus Limnocylindria bacterium]